MGALRQLWNLGSSNILFPTISGLIGDYDFTDTSKITLAGSKISVITDKSGQGNDLSQGTDANRPTYYNSGGPNGVAYARFDGNLFLSKALTLAQPFSYFLLFKNNEFVDQSTILEFSTYTNGLAQYTESGTKSVTPVNGTAWSGKYYYTAILNKWFASGFAINGSSSIIYNEGFKQTITTPGAGGMTKFSIGSATCPQTDICRVLLFNRVLNDSEMISLFNYFNLKYKHNNIPKLISVGDSIAYGELGSMGNTNYNGYARMLAWGTDIGYSTNTLNGALFNIAHSGDKLTDTIPIVNNNIQFFKRGCKVLIENGTNEINASIPFDSTYISNYNGMLSTIINAGVLPTDIILITPPYSSTRISQLTILQGVLNGIASTNGCKYCDTVTPTLAGGGDTLLTDGQHPNTSGHVIMANAILPLLT